MDKLDFIITALADIADECDNRNLHSQADELTAIMNVFCKFADLNKVSYIKQIQQDGKTKYEVKSSKNKDWSGGTYSTREEAEKRLKEVEMFKHMK